jgi:hypothetical protein
MHPRSLQRGLATEGVGCQDLIDRERRALAARYLAEPGLHLSQIAGLVGYTEQSGHLLAMPFEPSSRRKVLVKDLDWTVKGPLALASGWLSRRTLDPCPSSTPSLRA